MKRLLVLLIALSLIGLTGCKEEEKEKDIVEFDELIQYLEGDGGNYVLNGSMPKAVAADVVHADLLVYDLIIDIRSATDYALGHINGAVNVLLANVVTYVETNTQAGDKILVACYTGQTAGHAVLALNLLGYDAYLLKFGMSAWHSSLDKWTANSINSTDYSSHFETAVTALPTEVIDYPVLDTGEKTGEEILRARIDAMLTAGFKSVTAVDLLPGKDTYFIINYFGAADHDGTSGKCTAGHIKGAYQFTPGSSLQTTGSLNKIPTDQNVAVYCWTGQTSSQVVAFLNVLGYTSKSIKWGVNGMVYSAISANKWTAAGTHDYELVQ